jgi:hypothetical protein
MDFKTVEHSLQNPFAGQLEANILFDIALVIDAAIKEKNSTETQFSQHAAFLLKAAGSSLTVGHLTNQIQVALTNNFDATLTEILNGSFRLPGGIALSRFERDVAVAYAIRNRGAHDVSSSSTIWQCFTEIQKALFNVLFGAVDYLY